MKAAAAEEEGSPPEEEAAAAKEEEVTAAEARGQRPRRSGCASRELSGRMMMMGGCGTRMWMLRACQVCVRP